MWELIPVFDVHTVFVAPYTEDFSVWRWILLMGFLTNAACGLAGTYLVLRRMSLMGDALSHSVLPGLVFAFLLTHSRGLLAMFIGAVVAAVLSAVIIEVIHRYTRVKQDAAICVSFTTLFALGVVMIGLLARDAHIDAEHVLYGALEFIHLDAEPFMFFGYDLGPSPVWHMGTALILTGVAIIVFYKELLVSSFDPGLATSLGIRPGVMHYALIIAVALVVVSAFQAVGAILVLAMLILPGATALLLVKRLPYVLSLVFVLSLLYTLGGFHLSLWLDCSMGAAMVVAGSFLFGIAWLFEPRQGLVWRLFQRSPLKVDIEIDEAAAPTSSHPIRNS